MIAGRADGDVHIYIESFKYYLYEERERERLHFAYWVVFKRTKMMSKIEFKSKVFQLKEELIEEDVIPLPTLS